MHRIEPHFNYRNKPSSFQVVKIRIRIISLEGERLVVSVFAVGEDDRHIQGEAAFAQGEAAPCFRSN
jgi:hypothetical protein